MLGETSCQGNAVAMCVSDPVTRCTMWGTPESCAVGESCNEGVCELLGDGGIPDGSQPSPDGYTDYWILGQLPAQTTVYLYARNGSRVTFGGTIDPPVTIDVLPDTFISRNVADLGYRATGTDWYFLQMTGDQPFMTHLDRVVSVLTGPGTMADWHGDVLHDKPVLGLHDTFYFAAAQSGTVDDILVLYSPVETTATIRHLGVNSGAANTQTRTFTGLFVSTDLPLLIGNGDNGSITVTADQPIAAGLFDELPRYPEEHYGSGYYFCNFNETELYDEYIHIHHEATPALHSLFMPAAATLRYLDARGTLVNTITYTGERSEYPRHADLGYDTSSLPYLVRSVSTIPFANAHTTPVATDVVAEAAYMGWNASLAKLEIYALSEDADVMVYDGRNSATVGNIQVPAGTVHAIDLDDLGFAANEPFLAAVVSDVPVYQQIRIPHYLRQYPGAIGPPI